MQSDVPCRFALGDATETGVGNNMNKAKKRKEILRYIAIVKEKADAYTTQVLSIKEDGTCGYGNGLHIEFKGTVRLITCEHVVRRAKHVFANPAPISGPIPRAEQDGKRYSCNIVTADRQSDIAVLNYSRTEDMVNITPYNLNGQPNYTNQIVNDHIGLAAYIHGVPGFNKDVINFSDGKIMTNCLTYTAAGGISKVSNELIQGDFAEKEIGNDPLTDLDGNVLQLTGGVRDISGMSGSGLWCFNQDNKLNLLGLLSYKDDLNIDIDQHLINCVPIWIITNHLMKT